MTTNPSNPYPTVRFGDMVHNINERILPEDAAGLPYVGLEHLDPESLKIRRWGTPDEVEAQKLRFYTGDIIFGKRRYYQKKLAVADFDGICSAHAMVLRAKPEVVLPEFLPFFMQSEMFFERAMAISVGSLSPTINWSALAKQQFPLPPLDEQRRIAEILWAVEETVNGYTESLEVAKHTFEILVRDRCTSKDNPAQHWQHITIQELVDRGIIAQPQDGNHGNDHPKASDYSSSGIPFIMANNIKNQTIDLEDCKYIPKTLADELRIGFSILGDVLLTHKGTVGEVAVVHSIKTDYIMLTPQVTYYRVLKPELLNHIYLYFYFRSPQFQQELNRISSQSTRAYVGITAQRTLPLDIPDNATQGCIVEELQCYEYFVRNLKAHIDQTQKLKKSLLTELLSNYV